MGDARILWHRTGAYIPFLGWFPILGACSKQKIEAMAMDDSEVLGFWSEVGQKNVSYNGGFLTQPVRSLSDLDALLGGKVRLGCQTRALLCAGRAFITLRMWILRFPTTP